MLVDVSVVPEFFAFTPRDLLPEDSVVFLYEKLFEELELEDFYLAYSSQGQASIDPRLMLRTIFFGLSHGIGSGRKLEDACRYDCRYMVLSGRTRPSYKNFSRFFKRHRDDLRDLFDRVVRVATELGLCNLDRLAIDGTRLKGYTSKHRTRRYEKLQPAIDAIEEELKKLGESLESPDCKADPALPSQIKKQEAKLASIRVGKARIEREAEARKKKPSPNAQLSLNDPDARSLMSRKEPFIMGYNGQAVVADKGQIIVAAELHDSTNDSQALEKMLAAAEKVTGTKAKQVLADCGYGSADNLKFCEDEGIEPIISLYDKKSRLRMKQLTPISDGSGFNCLDGVFMKATKGAPKSRNVTLPPKERCAECVKREECLAADPKKKTFSVPMEENFKLLMKQTDRIGTKEFAEIYKRRKGIVEPIFANIKVNKALAITTTRKPNVDTWWKVVCTAHNIEKIIKNNIESLRQSPRPA